MDYHSLSSVVIVLVCLSQFCVGQYAIPTITFEAFTPKGLRISIPAEKGVELFGFHGKLNKEISQIEPGEFSEDVTRPTNGRFTFINPSIKLKEGDKINYWAYVQYEQLGFRKDDQSWTVDRLFPEIPIDGGPTCRGTITTVQGKSVVCSGDTIINYKFTESILNSQIWEIEQFIPHEPDWEYVIYTNESDVIAVENSFLRIKPKVVEENAMKHIVIEGCTRKGNPLDCNQPFEVIFQPPIVSARVVSKTAFSFAQVTIKAKLPQGDWIFPEIYLEDVNDYQRRIILAHAVGNKELTEGGNYIGGKVLFGGPYIISNERRIPVRDHLASYGGQKHIGDSWHTFKMNWTKAHMDLYMDDINYGIINEDALRATGFNKETMVRLVIGVGAGGVYNFPDSSKSGSYVKPWKSQSRLAVKNFLKGKELWEKTWNADSQLLVEQVTVKAL